ncbi:MAG: DUF58 domain-containing protein [Acutalibacteraceae bacterium]
MIISWIIYLAVVIATGAFFILYKDLLALILFLSVLCVPIILLVIHLISFLLTKIEVGFDKNSSGMDKPIKIFIKVKNRSPFAITHIKLTSKCKNLFLNTEHDCKFVISASPFSEKTFCYELNSKHIGNIDFSLKKAVFYDFFSMFCFSKRLNISKVIPVYPPTVSVLATIRPNNWFIGEAEKFSRAKAGDDPSEVFDIREYREGDKLNKIHWKLTSKTDKYMVKEYSLPVSDNIFIYLDLKIKENSDKDLTLVDSLIKSFISVSLNFINQGISHYVGWYNSRRNAFIKAKIKSEEDVFITLNKIFSDTVFTADPMMENCEFFLKSKYSHIIFMTSNSAKEVESQFAGFDIALSLKSIVSVEYERSDIPSTLETEFIPIIPENEEQCLFDIKF